MVDMSTDSAMQPRVLGHSLCSDTGDRVGDDASLEEEGSVDWAGYWGLVVFDRATRRISGENQAMGQEMSPSPARSTGYVRGKN